MPEDIPENDRKLTSDELLALGSEWSDARKDYGWSGAHDHVVFEAGWKARHLHGYTPQTEHDERRAAAAQTRAAEGKGFECDEDAAPLDETGKAEGYWKADESPEIELATVAEEPVEWRVQRAFANGYREGLERGARGRFDHS